MRKLIVLIFIIGFVGSASAAEVTYHFTAEIQSVDDRAEIFSEWEGEYSVGTELKGTITIDPELEPLQFYLDPSVARAFNWWDTGVISFEDQGYLWLDGCIRFLLIQNYSTDHEIKIMTKQGDLNVNPNDPEMMQMITATIAGLDASMPNDLDLGNSPQYAFQFTKPGGLVSNFNANITAIMTSEEYANSTAQKVKTAATAAELVEIDCPCIEDKYKNHGEYVSCVAQAAGNLLKLGDISEKKKDAMVSEAAKKSCGKKNMNKNKNQHKKKK